MFAAQLVQVVAAVLEYLPAAQVAQEAAPALAEYRPGLQEEHEDAAVAL